MRRGQAAVLVAACALPALALALIALACLGARVRAERAQRLADTAALRVALGLDAPAVGAARLAIGTSGAEAWAAVAVPPGRLVIPLLRGPLRYDVRAVAAARRVRTAEGRTGAVLVG